MQISLQLLLIIMIINHPALSETWMKPEDSATLASLSKNYVFSHTPRTSGRSGGTGRRISNDRKFKLLPPLCDNKSFESHAVTILHPVNIHIVVIYHIPPPVSNRQSGQLRLDSYLPEPYPSACPSEYRILPKSISQYLADANRDNTDSAHH